MKRFVVASVLMLLVLLMTSFVAVKADTTPANSADDRDIVVLTHGLGRSNTAMWWLAKQLEEAGYEVHRVGYHSLNTSTNEMLASISEQIANCCSKSKRTVHFVGHSLGGLMIRTHLQTTRPARLGHVVLIGTPNQGAELANRAKQSDWVTHWYPIVNALAQDGNGLAKRLPLPDYPVGVIAGVVKRRDNESYLPGPDDGVVTLASTKLATMTDFVQVDSGHAMMRYNNEVARQTVAFLREGRFDHGK